MSLDLDTRQRAMLEEMGIRLWWPAGAPHAEAEAADPVGTPKTSESIANSAAPERPGDGLDTHVETTGVPRPAPQAQSPRPPAPPIAAPMPPLRPTPQRPVLPAGAAARAGDHTAGRPVDALDWPGLQQAVASCQACKLCETRKNTVFGVGQAPQEPGQAPQVDWLIVGEAPGENEDLQGEPFVGQAGKLLDNMLKAVDLARQRRVYIANVLKCRPPANRNPAPEEIARCEPFLLRQVALLRPRIILAMGRFAINTLLAPTVAGVENIPVGRLRGKVYQYQGVPVVVSYHPAYLLRNLPDKAKAWEDLCLARATWHAPPTS